MNTRIKHHAILLSLGRWTLITLLAILYYTAGRLGQLGALPPGYVSPIWPSSGIALAAVLIFGNTILPSVFLGSFFNNLLLFSDLSDLFYILQAIFMSVSTGFGATLQAFVGGYLLKRYTNSKPLDTTNHVFKFILISLGSCLVNSTIGSSSLHLVQSIQWLETWWTWWVGDTAGILIFTPFILSWYFSPFQPISKWKLAEAGLLTFSIFLFIKIIFNNSFHLTYLLIPLIIWAGFRFHQQGITLAVVFISTFTIIETMQGKGPFFVHSSLNMSLLLLELFFAILASTAYLLIAALQERQHATNLLELYNMNLENTVKERTNALQEQIEQIKKMQQQIITQERLASLGTLLAGVAHELKNPLNFVKNFSELSLTIIEQLNFELESQKENVQSEKYEKLDDHLELLFSNVSKIVEHTNRANNIIQGMLSHAKDKPKQREETDLNALIHEYSKLIYHSRKQKNPILNVQLKINLDPSVKPIFVNKQNISRVILNIVDNAFDALEEKRKQSTDDYHPQLEVSTKDLNDQIEIVIYDNGTGISASNQDKIFIPFFTEKESGEGTGLGLSISYNIIVKEHGGTIEFKSKEREFTQFIIHIPKHFSS